MKTFKYSRLISINAVLAAMSACNSAGAPSSSSKGGHSKVRTMIAMGRNMGSNNLGDVYIAGRTTFYDDLIRMAGGVNVYTGDIPIPAVSKEGIAELNPEVMARGAGNGRCPATGERKRTGK
jgi:ABC-type Fe3+-hydroxamate transport system substrate-binding protein